MSRHRLVMTPAVTATPCPACGAKARDRCKGYDGTMITVKPHWARVDAAHTASSAPFRLLEHGNRIEAWTLAPGGLPDVPLASAVYDPDRDLWTAWQGPEPMTVVHPRSRPEARQQVTEYATEALAGVR